MATHSSLLAWRIPWTEKPGRLQSMGSHRVGHDWSDLAAAAAKCVGKKSVKQVKEIMLLFVIVWDISVLSQFSSVSQSDSLWPWTAAHQDSLSITNSQSLLKLMSIESVMPSKYLILLSSPPAFNLSQHQSLLQWVSSSHEVPKVIGASASGSASVLPMNIQGWFPLGNSAISDALVLILHNVYFITILWFFLPLPWPLKKTYSKLQFYKASMFILGRGKDKDR